MPPNAKTDTFEAGVFGGMDVLVRSHAVSATSRPAPGFGTCRLNIDGVTYVFSEAPAHQLASWNGRHALTAVIKLFNSIDSVRSNIRPEARIQGVITEGGAAPNVVPDRAWPISTCAVPTPIISSKSGSSPMTPRAPRRSPPAPRSASTTTGKRVTASRWRPSPSSPSST